MGEAPRDLSDSRGTTRLGDPGRYSFGEDVGQQGTGPGLGFALPEYGLVVIRAGALFYGTVTFQKKTSVYFFVPFKY